MVKKCSKPPTRTRVNPHKIGGIIQKQSKTQKSSSKSGSGLHLPSGQHTIQTHGKDPPIFSWENPRNFDMAGLAGLAPRDPPRLQPHLCFSALVGTDEVAVRQHTSCHEPGDDWLKLQVAAIIDRYRLSDRDIYWCIHMYMNVYCIYTHTSMCISICACICTCVCACIYA